MHILSSICQGFFIHPGNDLQVSLMRSILLRSQRCSLLLSGRQAEALVRVETLRPKHCEPSQICQASRNKEVPDKGAMGNSKKWYAGEGGLASKSRANTWASAHANTYRCTSTSGPVRD